MQKLLDLLLVFNEKSEIAAKNRKLKAEIRQLKDTAGAVANSLKQVGMNVQDLEMDIEILKEEKFELETEIKLMKVELLAKKTHIAELSALCGNRLAMIESGQVSHREQDATQ